MLLTVALSDLYGVAWLYFIRLHNSASLYFLDYTLDLFRKQAKVSMFLKLYGGYFNGKRSFEVFESAT